MLFFFSCFLFYRSIDFWRAFCFNKHFHWPFNFGALIKHKQIYEKYIYEASVILLSHCYTFVESNGGGGRGRRGVHNISYNI